MIRPRVTRVLQALALVAVAGLAAGIGNLLLDAGDSPSGADASRSRPPTRAAPPPASSPTPAKTETEKNTTGPTPTAGRPVSSSATPQPPPSSTPSLDGRDRAALRFVRAYTDTNRPRKTWLAHIKKLATSELARGLAYTDLAVVPNSQPTGEVATATRAEVTITKRMPLHSGTVLLVTLKPGSFCPHGWCADTITPAGGRGP